MIPAKKLLYHDFRLYGTERSKKCGLLWRLAIVSKSMELRQVITFLSDSIACPCLQLLNGYYLE
jgi:hypothetical protein